MEFIKPKMINKVNSEWKISEQTKAIVKYYAEYTDYTESEIVDKFLKNLLKDEGFVKWANKRRNNKKINAIILTNNEILSDNSEGEHIE